MILPGILSAGPTFYKGTGGKIKDVGSGMDFSITLSGISPSVAMDTFGIEAVCIKVSHKDISKLAFSLVAPDGTTIALATNIGSGKSYDSTIFSDSGTMLIDLGKAPFRDNFKGEGQLKGVNNGQKINKTWKLHVTDSYTPAGTGGSLTYWYLVVGDHPAADVKLFSSNLPILIFNTRGVTMPYWSKTAADMKVIYNSAGKRNFIRDSSKYKGYCQIGIRGSSSSSFPKKSYGIDLTDRIGNSVDSPFLGMPLEHSWDLVANYTDKTLLNNYLAYMYGRRTGHCAPRTRMAEVIVNGVYQGVYLIAESIKRNSNRVPISKIDYTTTSGDSLTGGYIVKIDKFTGASTGYWTSNYLPVNHSGGQEVYYQYEYPFPLPAQQQDYIQKYIDSFETALNGTNFQDTAKGWRKYAYERDMIDYFIVNELSRNVDGYRLSTFLYKDRNSNGGKIHMGPVWDYDLAFGNADYYSGSLTSGWAYSSTDPGDGYQPPFWWAKYMKDSTFKNDLKCRWTTLRSNLLSDSAIKSDIDTGASILSESEKRNFNEWPELGIYVWPEPTYPATYALEITNKLKWVKARTAWLDKNIPGTCRADYIAPVVKLNYKDTVYLEVKSNYIDSGITYNDNRDGKNCTITISKNLDSSQLGTYFYEYTVSDKSGNKTSVIRIVNVIDTIPPVINFANGDTVTVEVFNKYNDTAVIFTDNCDTSLIISSSGSFSFANNIPNKIGIFTIDYFVSDNSGNITQRTHYIHVVDTIAPAISLVGNSIVNILQNDIYADSGYTVKDNYDVAPVVTKSGTFTDTKSAGSFTIDYSVRDHSGNIGNSVTRTINIAAISGLNKDEISAENIAIYPNPTKGDFIISTHTKQDYHISLFNSLGIVIRTLEWKSAVESEKIISFPAKCPEGIYFLKIESADLILSREIILSR